MYTKRFLDRSIPDRFRLIISDRNVDYIYELLSKHLRDSVEVLKTKYNIELNVVRQRIFISGSDSDIYELFQYLSQYAVQFESITGDCLRIDLTQFINKIR